MRLDNQELGELQLKFSMREDGALIQHYPRHRVCKPNCTGYVAVSFRQRKVLGHHVAWALYYGEWPKGGDIDHINRIKHDNRKDNLRLVSRSVNMHNTYAHADAKSKHKGVDFCAKRGVSKWRARVCINYKTKQLGYFLTEQDAANAISRFWADNPGII